MNTIGSRVAIAMAALVAAVTASASAQDCCCHCGGCCNVRPMCRLECKPEVIKDYCYGCECEDICIPGCYKRGCLHCDGCCGDCEDAEDCHHCGCRPWCHLEWFDWCPTCAKPKCIKKLVKYEISREVPRYKWVVEYVCANCCRECGCYHPCDEQGQPVLDGEGPGAGDEAPMPPPVLPPPPLAAPKAAQRPAETRLKGFFQP